MILSLAVLIAWFPPLAAAGKTDYIVKLKSSDRPFALVSAGEMRRLDRAGLLEWAEPDGDAVLLGSLSPYYADEQWNLDMIGADAAFRQNCLGQGIRVGVLDSGVNPHPDFGDRLLPGHNYTPDAEDPNDTGDTYGHGTRIAGLIAAAGEEGYVGTAPGAEIVPIKVTDGKSVKISAICAAIYGAIDDYGCSVLNLSMGVQTDYESLREAVAYAEAKGVVVVSAAGNNGTNAVYYPAGYDTVIGVGAVDNSGVLYYHSNHNSGVFLTAPGVDVRSTAFMGGYTASTGTSFAVPQVSGAAAVLLGMDGSLTAGEIRSLLAKTASDSGDEGYDVYYGYGILNLAGCVAALGEAPPEEEPAGPTGPAHPCSFLPESGPAAFARNDSAEALDCLYLLARYDESGTCLGVTIRRLLIPAGETAVLDPPEGNGTFVQFLCAAETLIPLTAERRSP